MNKYINSEPRQENKIKDKKFDFSYHNYKNNYEPDKIIKKIKF